VGSGSQSSITYVCQSIHSKNQSHEDAKERLKASHHLREGKKKIDAVREGRVVCKRGC
jgi:Ca2+-dependent lipid-binding protein